MSLKDEAKSVFERILGSEVAKQLDSFDDPEKYPRAFLDECLYFLEKFIGKEAAKKKLKPLYEKYKIKST
ncbi:MAG: hypothetical protein J7K72_02750 [Candidatus Aenigmarchaeota archaeon]|nr:hypothetical protein [Candidatus Aenigmarchaeota archaeon]